MELTSNLHFTEPPFQDRYDPGFLFLTAKHEAILADLVNFLTSRRGLALLLGEEGVGKTILLSVLGERLPPAWQAVVVSHPLREALGLVQTMAAALGLTLRDRDLVNFTAFAQGLKAAVKGGRNPVLLVDDAQDLTDDHLTEIWLLSQMEHDDGLLLPILLVGRNSLVKKLDSRSHERLRAQIGARFTLPPLTPEETILYLDHRLRQVGSSFSACFSPECSGPLFATTGGVPRRLNQRAREALERCRREGLPWVSRALLSGESRSLPDLGAVPPKPRRGRKMALAAALVLALSLSGYGLYRHLPEGLTPWRTGTSNAPLAVTQKAAETSSPKTEPVAEGPTGAAPEGPGSGSSLPPPEARRPSEPPPVAAAAPSPPETRKSAEATYRVLPDDYLTKIAAKLFPRQPKIGYVALLLANPDLGESDLLFPGQVLKLPEVNPENGVIKVNGQYFYLWRRFFGETPELSGLREKLEKDGIRLMVKESWPARNKTVYRLFVGGYDSEPELQEALQKAGIK